MTDAQIEQLAALLADIIQARSPFSRPVAEAQAVALVGHIEAVIDSLAYPVCLPLLTSTVLTANALRILVNTDPEEITYAIAIP